MSFLDEIAWNADGLLPAIAQGAKSDEVLMMAWMNVEALQLTINTGWAHYWSRSRKSLWRKGETSGHTQQVAEIRLDCDGDVLLLKVHQMKVACHTGHRRCFFRHLQNGAWVAEKN